MELSPGYKRTEVGVIPEDWDVVPLGQVGESLIGLTYRPEDVSNHGTLVLRASNIQGNALRFEDNVFVDMEIPERIMVQPGDVLICVRNGSRDLIGKSALLDSRTNGMTFGAFMSVFRSSNGHFISYLFQSHILKRQIEQHLGATINQITNKSLNSFLVPLPLQDDERNVIATVLNDVDALLQGLERLIAKKRDLKKAAMQQLLTGQTRLPGFTGEWEVKRLDELADIRSGGTPSTKDARFWNGDILWCTPTDITALDGKKYLSDTSRKITREGLESSAAELIPPCSIIMTSRATIGECAINTVPVSTNQGFKNLIPFESVDTEFLYYLLTTQKQNFVSLCAGSTFLEISMSQVSASNVRLPALKTEQTAIATVLSDMDTELAALEQRLTKTRDLKQSMMQELLTGKTRLLAREVAHA